MITITFPGLNLLWGHEDDFTSSVLNDALQVGDGVYYVTPSPSGGFNAAPQIPTFIGYLVEILPPDVSNGIVQTQSILVDDVGVPVPAGVGDFIMFSKDSSINISGLVGYYAEVEIRNNSKINAEMYTIGSEITVSSK